MNVNMVYDMQELKQVAQIENRAIGGSPLVNRYWDSENIKYIDIYEANNRPEKGVKTCATIGLSKTDIHLISGNKDVRIELISACDNSIEDLPSIIASTAFEIMDKEEACYGAIIDNVISEYVEDSEMAHVYLMNPFLWDDLKTIEFPDKWVSWLLAIPISDKEKDYAIKNGYEALEDLFEKKQIDVYDLYRKSVV